MRPREIVRFAVIVLLFLISLLVIVPAPTTLAWFIAIGVTEWGQLVAIAALVAIVVPWRSNGTMRVFGTVLGIATIVLSLRPVVQAYPILSSLDRNVDSAFGAHTIPRPTFEIRHDTATFVADRATHLMLGMDVYRPMQQSKAPLVLIIHGGSWSGGDRKDLAPLNTYLAKRGFVVATITYRLAPQSPFPAASHDVAGALVYFKQHAANFGIDSSRIVIVGRSAGGQLALLAAYTAHDPAVRGVVGLYAPSDLRYGYAHPSNPRVLDSRATLRKYLGGSPEEVGAQYDAASPINFVRESKIPTLLIHGRRDELVSVQQSNRLSDTLHAAGVRSLYLQLPWATHGCDFNLSGPCGRITRRAITSFVAAVTR